MMHESERSAGDAARPRRGRHVAILACLGVLLAGCSLAPPFEPPAAPIAPDYPADTRPAAGKDGADAAQTPGDAAATAWPDYFADALLQDLIRQALANSRDLRSAVLRVEESRALYGIRRADEFPTINIGADGTRGRVPADIRSGGKAGITSQFEAGASLATWELDFWGRVRNLKEAALEEFLATDAARRAVTVSLVAQVADAYLTLRELDERIELARRTIATREESFRIFTRRFEVGATSRLELAQVETLLTQAQTLGANSNRPVPRRRTRSAFSSARRWSLRRSRARCATISLSWNCGRNYRPICSSSALTSSRRSTA